MELKKFYLLIEKILTHKSQNRHFVSSLNVNLPQPLIYKLFDFQKTTGNSYCNHLATCGWRADKPIEPVRNLRYKKWRL